MGKECDTDWRSHGHTGMENTAGCDARAITGGSGPTGPSGSTSPSTAATAATGSEPGSTGPVNLRQDQSNPETRPATFDKDAPIPRTGTIRATTRENQTSSESVSSTSGSGKLKAPSSPGSNRRFIPDPKIVDSRMEYFRKAIARGRQRRRAGRPQQHRRGPTDLRGIIRLGGYLILLLAAGSEPSHGFPSDQPDSRAPPPFAYERNHDLRNQKVVFNPVGQYATDVSFIHAEIRMPFKHIPKRIHVARSTIEQARRKANGSENFSSSTVAALEAMEVPIDFAQVRYEDILKKLPEHDASDGLVDEHGRYKRFDPVTAAIGVGTSIIGWVFEYFKAKEIQGIKADLRRVQDNTYKLTANQKLLFATTLKHQEILANHSLLHLRNYQRWNDFFTMDQAAELTKIQQISSMVQEEVRIFSNTVAMAQLGRLNPDQISTEALSGILDFVRLATHERKLVSPVQVTGDIFAMPMSYVYNRADKVFYFIVHIPLVRPEQVMDMFEYVPFPMTLSTSETHVALPRPGAHDVLAINQNQEYQLLSSGELQHCFKLAKVHYCKGRQVLKTNFRKSCLGALYVKDSEAASWYCDFQIQPADERVFKLSGDEYLIFTRKDLLVTRTCGAAQTQLQITEGTRINVSAGCNVRLEDHQIYGEESTVLPGSEPKVFDWRWDAKRILKNISESQFQAAIRELEHEAGMISFETEDILQQVDLNFEKEEAHDTFGWAKWITPLISGAIYFTVTMILLGVGKAYYAHYQAQRSPKPSAPAYTITMENPGQHRRPNETPLTFSMPTPR